MPFQPVISRFKGTNHVKSILVLISAYTKRNQPAFFLIHYPGSQSCTGHGGIQGNGLVTGCSVIDHIPVPGIQFCHYRAPLFRGQSIGDRAIKLHLVQTDIDLKGIGSPNEAPARYKTQAGAGHIARFTRGSSQQQVIFHTLVEPVGLAHYKIYRILSVRTAGLVILKQAP